MNKVLFTSSQIVAARKGIYNDPMRDFDGFKVISSLNKGKPTRRRKWGEDPEFDAVMSNFGQTPDTSGDYPDLQMVFGYANVAVQEDGSWPIDWEGDVIPTDVLEAAAYNFVLKHGLLNQMHQWDTECGWLIESMVFTKEKMAALGIPEGTVPEAWFVGFYIPDPVVFAKVKNGEYNMFSIEGSAIRIPIYTEK
jgi:hypothetical protein